MGSTFGRSDKNATNDVLNGQVVATGTPGAQTVKDPNQGLSDEQVRNKKLLSIGGGLMSNLSQDQSQQPGGQQIDFLKMNQPKKMPFYGDYRG